MCVSVLCPCPPLSLTPFLAPAPAPSANHICVALCHLKGMKTARTGLPREATSAHSRQMAVKMMGLSPSKGLFSGNSPFKIGSSPTPPPGFWSLVSNMGLCSGPALSVHALPKGSPCQGGQCTWDGLSFWSPGFPFAVPANLWALTPCPCPRHDRTLEVLQRLGVHEWGTAPLWQLLQSSGPPTPSTPAASSITWINQAPPFWANIAIACGFQRAGSWDVLGPWQNGGSPSLRHPLPRPGPGSATRPTPHPQALLILPGGLGGPNTKYQAEDQGPGSLACRPRPCAGTPGRHVGDRETAETGSSGFLFHLPNPTQLFTARLAADSRGGQPCGASTRRQEPGGAGEQPDSCPCTARAPGAQCAVCICVSGVFVFLLHVLLLLLSLSPHPALLCNPLSQLQAPIFQPGAGEAAQRGQTSPHPRRPPCPLSSLLYNPMACGLAGRGVVKEQGRWASLGPSPPQRPQAPSRHHGAYQSRSELGPDSQPLPRGLRC